jgi:hypothetical protein
VLVSDDSGKQTVLIAADAEAGYPSKVYAMHVQPPTVIVHDDVRLEGNDGRRFATDTAQVYVDDSGSVHIAAVEGLTATSIA